MQSIHTSKSSSIYAAFLIIISIGLSSLIIFNPNLIIILCAMIVVACIFYKPIIKAFNHSLNFKDNVLFFYTLMLLFYIIANPHLLGEAHSFSIIVRILLMITLAIILMFTNFYKKTLLFNPKNKYLLINVLLILFSLTLSLFLSPFFAGVFKYYFELVILLQVAFNFYIYLKQRPSNYIMNFLHHIIDLTYGLAVWLSFITFFVCRNFGISTTYFNGGIQIVFRGILNNANILGFFASLYLIYLIYRFINFKNNKILHNVYLIVSIVVAALTLALAWARAATISFFIGLIIMICLNIWYSSGSQKLKLLLTTIFTLLIVSSATLYLNSYTNFVKINDYNKIVKTYVFKGRSSFSMSLRELYWANALKDFENNPIVGTGYLNYRIPGVIIDNSRAGTLENANSYITLLQQSGLTGFIPVMFFLLYVIFAFIIHFFRKKNKIDIQTGRFYCFLISVYFLFLFDLFFEEWLIKTSPQLIVYLLFVAAMLGIVNNKYLYTKENPDKVQIP